jgi:hypothetical protein
VQPGAVEQLPAADTEQITDRNKHALLGQHGMNTGLEPGPQGEFPPL